MIYPIFMTRGQIFLFISEDLNHYIELALLGAENRVGIPAEYSFCVAERQTSGGYEVAKYYNCKKMSELELELTKYGNELKVEIFDAENVGHANSKEQTKKTRSLLRIVDMALNNVVENEL